MNIGFSFLKREPVPLLNLEGLTVLNGDVIIVSDNDRSDESVLLFKRVFGKEPTWRELVPRLVHPGILPDEATARRIVEVE